MKPLDSEDPKREADEQGRDRRLEQQGDADPGSAFTRESQERSWNTEYGTPPKPAEGQNASVLDKPSGAV